MEDRDNDFHFYTLLIFIFIVALILGVRQINDRIEVRDLKNRVAELEQKVSK